MKSPKSATDPDVDGNGGDGNGSVVLGLIGHPNVGKSSMVNHLMGEKVVSVKATPGHTKILQTLQLNENTCLCDSPGVVFPRLEVPREAQIVAGLVSFQQRFLRCTLRKIQSGTWEMPYLQMEILMGKPSTNSGFSIASFDFQRVTGATWC